MQRSREEATGPSRPTQTLTESSVPESHVAVSGTLHLRGHHSDERRVAWTDNTIDNEKLGRKSSKICCIYHKPKAFDESSSEDSSSSSDSDDTGDEHEKAASQNLKRKLKEKRMRRQSHEKDDCCHEGKQTCSGSEYEHKPQKRPEAELGPSNDKNAFERGVK